MRRRLYPAVSNRFDTEPTVPKVQLVSIESSVPLVTLAKPGKGLKRAAGAFCRLQPPEEMSAPEIEAWRSSVEAVALAVKVLPQPKAADVPEEAQRVEHEEDTGTVREEASALAEATGTPGVVEFVTQVLDEVGAP